MNHVIKPDKMIVMPLNVARLKERTKVKLAKVKLSKKEKK